MAKVRRIAKEDGPDPMDVHVGNRVRLRRSLLGMSQEQLAAVIGVSFQQVQKYERGTNRISASRLFDVARALEVPISFFFDDSEQAVDARAAEGIGMAGPAPRDSGEDPLSRSESLEVVEAYWRLDDSVRNRMHDLLVALSRGGD